MGKYINETGNGAIGATMKNKCDALIADGATELYPPEQFRKDLVCVVDNGFFAAAGYAFDEKEMEVFKRPDGRPRRWFIYPNVKIYAR